MNVKKIIIMQSIIIVILTACLFGVFKFYTYKSDNLTDSNREYKNRLVIITDKYNNIQTRNKELNTLIRNQQEELDSLTRVFNRATELAYSIGERLEGDEDIIQRAVDTLSDSSRLIQFIIENEQKPKDL